MGCTEMNGLLLDTHVWIWLMNGSVEIANSLQKKINTVAKQAAINIAAISVWELAMLVSKNRVKLGKPVMAWIDEALALPGIVLQPLTKEIAVESTQLPFECHNDPADRMIIATARIHQLTLITADQKIMDYAKQKYLSAITCA
jgi:PIN domain nuclease of toxin-antitoxin system